MSTEENKDLVRRFYEEIDKGNLAAMDELVAEEYIVRSVFHLSSGWVVFSAFFRRLAPTGKSLN